jgi:polyisoprenoid-binding protein YceI
MIAMGVVGAAVAAGSLAWAASASNPATVASIAASASVGAADAKPFAVDGVHSTVIYRIKHAGAAWNYGRFNKVSGKFHLDLANPSASVLEVTVDAGSVDSANSKRDDHLKSQDFFSTKEFPTITFKGKSFESAGEKSLRVTGDLSMLGKTKPVTVTVDHTGEGEMRGVKKAGLEAKFDVKRSDFGMTYGVENGALSDEVTLIVALEGDR